MFRGGGTCKPNGKIPLALRQAPWLVNLFTRRVHQWKFKQHSQHPHFVLLQILENSIYVIVNIDFIWQLKDIRIYYTITKYLTTYCKVDMKYEAPSTLSSYTTNVSLVKDINILKTCLISPDVKLIENIQLLLLMNDTQTYFPRV